jgi:hypothetical protein
MLLRAGGGEEECIMKMRILSAKTQVEISAKNKNVFL